ncbi:SMODS domain-containing nucleotidyltransferase [Enorma sp.]|uniref:SMODS domain-containing nucleotidyltransferase n=1 Tax=Enorma sp. TaxID=1920692 RepID=UPI003AB6C56E
MSISDDFAKFLADIEPSSSTVSEISSVQKSLREYLSSHEEYSCRCQSSYLSGSYAKHTAIRPAKDDGNRDVDIVVETDHSTDDGPADVLEELRSALADASKYSTARVQTHSVGIQLSKLDIDVVPLAKEDESWYIGDAETGEWSQTNPKGHKEWATEVNEEHDGKYKPVVKILKWWRREHCPEGSRWPKGITLEKMVADSFPEEMGPYGDLVASVFRSMHDHCSDDLASGVVPFVDDPSLPGNDLAASYSIEDFREFDDELVSAIALLDESGSTNEVWRKILGERFPVGSSKAELSLPASVFLPTQHALAVSWRERLPYVVKAKGFGIQVYAEVETKDGKRFTIRSNDRTIPKDCTVVYHVLRSPSLRNCSIRWQIVNTGTEAISAGCKRGEIAASNESNGFRRETTAYTGRHYVQCFAIRNGVCIARSKEFFINVS